MTTPTASRPRRRRRRRCAVCNELFHELAPCEHCDRQRVCAGCAPPCPDCSRPRCRRCEEEQRCSHCRAAVCTNTRLCQHCYREGVCKSCLAPCPTCARPRCRNCDREDRCERCGTSLCTNTSDAWCELCDKSICDRCARTCPCCETSLCSTCFERKVHPCRHCNEPFCPNCSGTCKDNSGCVNCEDEERAIYCKRCLAPCPDCGASICPNSEHSEKCAVCGNRTCWESSAWCQACDKRLCPDCTVRSYSGGMGGENVFCEKCARAWNAWPCSCADGIVEVGNECSECGEEYCGGCCYPCRSCGELVCKYCEDRHARDKRREELAESGSDEPCQRCQKRPVGTVCEQCYREICNHCVRSCPICEDPVCWRCLRGHRKLCEEIPRNLEWSL